MAKKKRQPENRAAEARRGDGTFVAGTSGNPGGRPKEERDVIEALRLAGVELAQKLIELAREGNVKAIEVALNRAYGKARERVDFKDDSRREIDFDSLPPDKAGKVAALFQQLEALLGKGLGVTAPPASASQFYDWARLTADELRTMDGLLEKASPGAVDSVEALRAAHSGRPNGRSKTAVGRGDR